MHQFLEGDSCFYKNFHVTIAFVLKKEKKTFSAWNCVDLNDVWSVTIFRHCVIPRKVAGLSVTVNSACLAMYTVNSLYQTYLTRTIINITLVNCDFFFFKAMIYWFEWLVFMWRREWTCLKAITNGTGLSIKYCP